MLLDAVIVKDRTRFAKPGSVMDIGRGQIFDHAHESPYQYQADAYKYQYSDHDIHAGEFRISAFLWL